MRTLEVVSSLRLDLAADDSATTAVTSNGLTTTATRSTTEGGRGGAAAVDVDSSATTNENGRRHPSSTASSEEGNGGSSVLVLSSTPGSSTTINNMPTSNRPASTSSSRRLAHSHWRSSLGAVANLCSATLGAGILSLPFAFYLTGWVVGSIMMVLSAAATITSIQILARASELRHSQAYETLVEQHMSPRASALTRLCIVVFCFGCAVAYIIAIGDLFQRLGLQRIPSMVAMWAAIMLPLSCQRKMKSLQCASAVGIASISLLVVCAGIQLWLDWSRDDDDDDGGSDGGSDAAFGNTTIHHEHQLKLWPSHGILGIFKACPIILFAFSCQVNVCAIYHELEVVRDHEDHDLDLLDGDDAESNDGASHRSLGIIPGIIEEDPASLHPMPPPAAFSESDSAAVSEGSSLLLNADRHDDESQGGVGAAPAIAVTEESDKSRAFDLVTYSAVAVCATLYTSISLLALLTFGSDNDVMTPNVLAKYSVKESVMQVAAAAVGLAVVLAFPLNVVPARTSLARSWVRPPEEHQSNPSRNQNRNRQQQQQPHSASATNEDDDDRTVQRSNYNTNSRSHVQTPLLQENRVRVRSRHRPIGTVAHAALTLLVAGGALLVAIVVPDISVVFGILGGTTTSWLGFCLPGWLGIQLLSKRWHFVSWMLLVGGVIIGVVTTAVTVATMF